MFTRRMLLEMAWRCHGDHVGCYRRVCVMCRATIYASRPEVRYCRPACRQRAYRQRRKSTAQKLAGVPSIG